MSAEALMPLPINSSPAAEYYSAAVANLAGRLSNTQVASITAQSVPNWIGEAADAYTDEIRQLRLRVEKLRDTTTPVRNVLDDWAEAVNHAVTVTVPNLHSEYNEATAQFERQKSDLEQMRDELESGIYHFELAAIRENYNDRVSEIVNRYKRAMNELDAKAQEIAGKIRAAIDSYISPEIVKKGRDAIGATIFDGMPLVDGQAQWEFAQSQAREAAALIGEGEFSLDDVKEFDERFGHLSDDPFFASALAETVPPARLLEFSAYIHANHYRLMEDDQYDGNFHKVNELQGRLGAIIALSMGGMNPGSHDGAQGSFDLVRDALRTEDGKTIGDLTKDVRDEWRLIGRRQISPDGRLLSPEVGEKNAPPMSHSGYEYLGAMFNAAAAQYENLALGPEFFDGDNSLAMDIIDWDHNHTHRPTGWGQGDGFPDFPPGGQGASFDTVLGMLRLTDQPPVFSSDGGAFLSEPANAALVQRNQERYDAVQRFLANDTPFEVGKDPLVNRVPEYGGDNPAYKGQMNMTRYLTSFRTPLGQLGMDDNGEALGRVLAQGAAYGEIPDVIDKNHPDYEKWLERQRLSTKIAANFLQGYQEGLEIDKPDYNGENAFGRANAALRSWAGEILAPHADDLAEYLANPYEKGFKIDLDAKGEWDIKISDSMRERLISTRGLFVDIALDKAFVDDGGMPDDVSDDTYSRGRMSAVDRLLLAAQAGYRSEIGGAVMNGDVSGSTVASSRWSALIAPLVEAPEEADNLYKRAISDNNARMQKLISTGLSFVPINKLVPDPLNPVIGPAFRAAQAPVLEALLPTGMNNDEGIARAHNAAEIIMRDGFNAALSDDPEFLIKYNNVRESMERVLIAKGVSVPPWITDAAVPMPRIEDMTEAEADAFLSSVRAVPEFENGQMWARLYAPNAATMEKGEANTSLGK